MVAGWEQNCLSAIGRSLGNERGRIEQNRSFRRRHSISGLVEKMSKPKMKRYYFLCLATFLILISFAGLTTLSCKKKEVFVPPPAPTPLPAAPAGLVVFVQRGHLAMMDLVTSEITP